MENGKKTKSCEQRKMLALHHLDWHGLILQVPTSPTVAPTIQPTPVREREKRYLARIATIIECRKLVRVVGPTKWDAGAKGQRDSLAK